MGMMTLSDAARAIQRLGPPEYDGIDLCCQRVQATQDHTPDCPWRSMPAIVAVIEAAKAYIAEIEGQGERVDVLKRVRAYRALADALKGEGVLTG